MTALQHLVRIAQATKDVPTAVRLLILLRGGSVAKEDIRRWIRPSNDTRFDAALKAMILKKDGNVCKSLIDTSPEGMVMLNPGPWNTYLRDFPEDWLRPLDWGPNLNLAVAEVTAIPPPSFDASVNPLFTPPSAPIRTDRLLIDRNESPSRSDRSDRIEASGNSKNVREYLLLKLRRMPKLEQEILRPQDQLQRMFSRRFWTFEHTDPEWLQRELGDLADAHWILNKAAALNKTMSKRLQHEKQTKAVPPG